MEDGYTIKYLPAELLRDLNIVDTPGTNVILERQQRLTEEYVPRADMVLFTMSAGGLRIVKPPAQCTACIMLRQWLREGLRIAVENPGSMLASTLLGAVRNPVVFYATSEVSRDCAATCASLRQLC